MRLDWTGWREAVRRMGRARKSGSGESTDEGEGAEAVMTLLVAVDEGRGGGGGSRGCDDPATTLTTRGMLGSGNWQSIAPFTLDGLVRLMFQDHAGRPLYYSPLVWGAGDDSPSVSHLFSPPYSAPERWLAGEESWLDDRL
nr:hypothetical protein CFP56_20876 [Quercus suber]